MNHTQRDSEPLQTMPREIGAPPIVVRVVVVTEWVQSHLSLYGPVLACVSRDRRSIRALRRLRSRPRGPTGRQEILVASGPDAAAVYVGTWLCALLVLTAFAPRIGAAGALTVALGVVCLAIATVRFLDLVSYQVGILLDPRQRRLRGPERSLVLLTLNLVELTLIETIWLYAGGLDSAGHVLSRGDVFLQSLNLTSLLAPIVSTRLALVVAQLASHFGAVLLLVVTIGMLLGLISASFERSQEG
jgi:hypothetical protein